MDISYVETYEDFLVSESMELLDESGSVVTSQELIPAGNETHECLLEDQNTAAFGCK